MVKAPLQSQGEDKHVCATGILETTPHGKGKPRVFVQHVWFIRAHRGVVLSYDSEQTDCQFIKGTWKRNEHRAEWHYFESPRALSAEPDTRGRVYLRATVPLGKYQGTHTWSRLVCWFFQRKPGMTWARWSEKDVNGQYKIQCNHVNRNPHITLVDQVEMATRRRNWEHYLEHPELHKRPAMRGR